MRIYAKNIALLIVYQYIQWVIDHSKTHSWPKVRGLCPLNLIEYLSNTDLDQTFGKCDLLMRNEWLHTKAIWLLKIGAQHKNEINDQKLVPNSCYWITRYSLWHECWNRAKWVFSKHYDQNEWFLTKFKYSLMMTPYTTICYIITSNYY